MDQPETESEVIEAQEAPEPSEIETTEPEVSEAPQEPIDDGEEVDYEGEKFKVPAKLKDALLRQADYTRKTQEVAEERRSLEQQRAEVAQRAEFNQKHVREVAKVMAIDERLEQYQKLDWDSLADADPVQAMKLDRQMRDLQSQRQQAVNSIEQIHERTALETHQATARRLQEAQAEVKRDIPNWSSELDMELKKTAMSFGFNEQEARVSDPRTIKLVHKAYLYDQLMKERTKSPQAAEPAKPVTRITAVKTTAVTNPDKLSPDDWLKWRNTQLRKR